jgi:hypothetical protein
MRIWRGCIWAISALVALRAAPVSAETPQQFDRLNTIAHYGMVMAWCDKLGMKLTPDWEDQIEPTITAEALSWGLTADAAKQLVSEAVTRQSRINQIDLDTLEKKNGHTEAGLRSIHSVFVKYGGLCLEAARDPLFSRFVTVPADFDLETAATEAADSLLKDGGLASWQTPAIQARGDLMMAAGACRSYIGPSRSDAIFQKYAHASNPREREYYVHSFDEGLADTSFNFDAAQCERLIKRLTTKASRSK